MTRLFLIDDHPTYREGLAALFSKYTREFEVVGQGVGGTQDILGQIAESRPDVLLMDLFMRNCNGAEFLGSVRSSFPEIKIIIFSMSEKEDDLFSAISGGVSAYVLKTVTMDELVSSIRLVASGEVVLSPSMTSKLVQEFRRETRSAKKELYSLSERELEILGMAAMGDSNKEIAFKCCISETTVKAHFRNILGKMDVKNRAGAVGLATTSGLINRFSEAAS